MHELQYLWRSGSVVGALGLSCPQHVGSSQTRDKSVSPALASGFLTTGPPGSVSVCTFKGADSAL